MQNFASGISRGITLTDKKANGSLSCSHWPTSTIKDLDLLEKGAGKVVYLWEVPSLWDSAKNEAEDMACASCDLQPHNPLWDHRFVDCEAARMLSDNFQLYKKRHQK